MQRPGVSTTSSHQSFPQCSNYYYSIFFRLAQPLASLVRRFGIVPHQWLRAELIRSGSPPVVNRMNPLSTTEYCLPPPHTKKIVFPMI